jgi:hypothetical protein
MSCILVLIKLYNKFLNILNNSIISYTSGLIYIFITQNMVVFFKSFSEQFVDFFKFSFQMRINIIWVLEVLKYLNKMDECRISNHFY